jgi:hypothetical protein
MKPTMKKFFGKKNILASEPMTKKEYCDYRGWKVPKDEDPNALVYLVEYEVDPDSKPNHEDHEGYISMSPKHVFDKAYKPSGTPLERMLIEKGELVERMRKLKHSIKTKDLPEEVNDLNEEQYEIMEEYVEVLDKKIKIAEND